jgi:hypothetical protein
VTAATLKPIIADALSTDSHFRTDESGVYWEIGEQFASHRTVVHSANEYVRGDAHTNTVEGYFSILKRGIYGVYQHVSEHHVKRYLAEFDFRYNERIALGIDDVERTTRVRQAPLDPGLVVAIPAAEQPEVPRRTPVTDFDSAGHPFYQVEWQCSSFGKSDRSRMNALIALY